jgi:serine/threonine protein kinase
MSVSQEQKEAEKLVGQVLNGTYLLEQLLVTGGMGAVFRGRHVRTGGVCAIKVLHSRAAMQGDLSDRFQDEARIIASLRHPNIVQVSDLDRDRSGMAFIAMELLEGEDLQDRIERTGSVPLEEALQITRQISSALHAAHERGVIHRDLKPRNIYLSRHEENDEVTQVAKVIDFGVSKVPKPADKATRDLLVLGTPRYMAPEGAMGQNSQIDGRSDEWSVAVILYRMLSGKLPFDHENVIDLFKQVINEDPVPIEQLVPTVPPHVAAAIKRALSKKKEDRFPTMLDFLHALEPPPARPPFSLKRSALFGLAGAGMAALFVMPLLVREMRGKKQSNQVSELLIQADEALREERWDDALRLAKETEAVPAQPQYVRTASENLKRRVERGRQVSADVEQINKFLADKDFDGALRSNRSLPPRTNIRITAQQHFDLLQQLVIAYHLQQAEAERSLGRCDKIEPHVKNILELVPDHVDALTARWRPCAAFVGQPPGPKKLAGYPPMRDVNGKALGNAGEYDKQHNTFADIDRFLREAQIAHDHGEYQKAVALAHTATSVSIRTNLAWRIAGVSACHLKSPDILEYVVPHLDPASKEFVRGRCTALGYKVTF